MTYVPNFVYKFDLKKTGLFVILLCQDGFESDYPEIKLQKNHFLKSVWKSNCPEVHCKILDSYLQSNG